MLPSRLGGDITLRIRPMVAKDAPAAAELASELGYPCSAQEFLSRLEGLNDGRYHAVLVADVDRQVIGWIHVTLRQTLTSAPHGEVVGLVVASSQRGCGVGRMLMLAAEDWGRRRGVERVRLKSRADRKDAHRFYEGLGYVPEAVSWTFSREAWRDESAARQASESSG